MKRRVIYIHGGDSFSRHEDFLKYLRTTPLRDPLGGSERPQRWTDVLAASLGESFEVYKPSMPNKHNARYDEWKIWFERYLALVEDGVILVGWSLGGMFLAKYLSEHEPMRQVSAAFILAAPSGEFASPDGSGDDCLQFRPTSNDIVNLPQRVSHLEFWHSQDDFVVPVTELEWYRAHIPAATFRVFADKNHFLVPELPELIGAIRLIS